MIKSNNKTYNFGQAAEIVGVDRKTVSKWCKQGIDTIEAMFDYKAGITARRIQQTAASKSKHTVTDGKKKLNTNELGARLGISNNKARDFIVRCGCKSLKDCRERLAFLETGAHATGSMKTHKTPYGTLTCREIHNIHPHKDDIDISVISGRLNRRGGMCPTLWWPKMPASVFKARAIREGIDPPQRTVTAAPPADAYMDRAKCFARGSCRHYSECTDAHFENKRPARCRKDRSCWES